MTVNLAWRDAMTAAGRSFNAEEHKAGWPQTMKPRQLANLQRPFANGNRQGMLACDALSKQIEGDCKAGAIQHTVEEHVRRVTFSRPIPIRWESAYWDGEAGKIRMARGEKEESSLIHHITASAFVEWLAAQEIEPSQHIAAWFKSQGVIAAKAAPEPAPAAQVGPVPGRSEPDSPPPRILKKAVLIRELEHEWPTIEGDMREASRNGLSKAKTSNHGFWDVEEARRWADRNGKMKKSAQVYRTPATFGSQFEQLTK